MEIGVFVCACVAFSLYLLFAIASQDALKLYTHKQLIIFNDVKSENYQMEKSMTQQMKKYEERGRLWLFIYFISENVNVIRVMLFFSPLLLLLLLLHVPPFQLRAESLASGIYESSSSRSTFFFLPRSLFLFFVYPLLAFRREGKKRILLKILQSEKWQHIFAENNNSHTVIGVNARGMKKEMVVWN